MINFTILHIVLQCDVLFYFYYIVFVCKGFLSYESCTSVFHEVITDL